MCIQGASLVIVLLCAASVARAEESVVRAEEPVVRAKNPGWDVAAEGQVALALQRLGALTDLKLRARHELYSSDSEFLSDNFVSLGLSGQLAPVFGHVGAQVDVQPASFLKLSGGYHFVGYFGTMGSLRSPTGCASVSGFTPNDASCDFHPIGFEDNPPGNTATGHRFWLEATVMGRVGNVIAVGGARAERWLMNATAGEFWVNELYGVPQARNDTTLTGGGALLYAVLNPEGRRPELLLGVADELAWSVGTDAFYNRVGPVAMLRVPRWGAMREVTAQVAVLFYTHERYLAGLPYVALAVSAATPDLTP